MIDNLNNSFKVIGMSYKNNGKVNYFPYKRVLFLFSEKYIPKIDKLKEYFQKKSEILRYRFFEKTLNVFEST